MEITLPNSQGNQSFHSVAGKRSNGRAVYLGDPRLALLGRYLSAPTWRRLRRLAQSPQVLCFLGKVQVVDSLRKNITREYKAKLTKDQRKAFRSQMWAFRRDPESLSAEEKQVLEALFEKIPALRPLYKVRLRFKEIFDTARDRITAARWLRELRRECGQLGLDLGSFFETYDRWKTKILNYFDARQTSAAVEGINNKARVITKRTYGLKSAKSLWDRLILDLNRASQAIGYSIERIRQMAKGLKALFDWSCT